MSTNRNLRFTPLWMAICVVIGILIGSFYANHFSGNRLNIINSSGNKLNNLLHIIDDQYVDTVNINDLVEKAMPQILAELVLWYRYRVYHPSGHDPRAECHRQRPC